VLFNPFFLPQVPLLVSLLYYAGGWISFPNIISVGMSMNAWIDAITPSFFLVVFSGPKWRYGCLHSIGSRMYNPAVILYSPKLFIYGYLPKGKDGLTPPGTRDFLSGRFFFRWVDFFYGDCEPIVVSLGYVCTQHPPPFPLSRFILSSRTENQWISFLDSFSLFTSLEVMIVVGYVWRFPNLPSILC